MQDFKNYLISGVKTIVFEATHVTQEDFSGHVQDIILYSGGFKSVKISGSVVCIPLFT